MSPTHTTTRLLQTISFTSSFDRVLIAPLLVGVAEDFNVGLGTASLVATAHFCAYGLMQVLWAFVSDRFGRVFALRVSLALAGTAGVVAFLSPSFLALVLARTLAGGAYAAGIPGALTYVGDTVPIERRQGPLTDLMRGTALGTAAGVVSGGLLAQFVSWRVAFLAVGVVTLLLTVLVNRLPEPQAQARAGSLKSLTTVLRNRWALLVMALGAGEGCALLGVLNFLPAALEDQGATDTATAGGVIAGYGLAILFVTPYVKVLSTRVRPSNLIALGGLPCVLALGLFVWQLNPVGVFVGCALLGVGWGLMHSTIQTWATEVAPAVRATAVSLFAASLFTGSALGSALGGSILGMVGYPELFTIFLLLGLVLATCAYAGRSKYAG